MKKAYSSDQSDNDGDYIPEDVNNITGGESSDEENAVLPPQRRKNVKKNFRVRDESLVSENEENVPIHVEKEDAEHGSVANESLMQAKC